MAMSMLQRPLDDLPPTDAGDDRLTSPVHLSHHEQVGLVKGGEELSEQMLGSRVPVGLKDHDHPPPKAILGRIEGRADLGRVVAVIIHDQHSANLALHLEAALDAGELLQRVPDDLRPDVQVETNCDGG